MEFTKEFKTKFKKYLTIINHETDYVSVIEAWKELALDSHFTKSDFIEILDHFIENEQQIIDGFNRYTEEDLSNVDALPDNFWELLMNFVSPLPMMELDLFYEGMTNIEISKYLPYFRNSNTFTSLFSLPVKIIEIFGLYLDWNKILHHTLFIDRLSLSDQVYAKFAQYYEMMFLNNVENDYYKPASFDLFMVTIYEGLQMDYGYILDAMKEKNTTFAEPLLSLALFNEKKEYPDDYLEPVEHIFTLGNETYKFDVSLSLLYRRFIHHLDS